MKRMMHENHGYHYAMNDNEENYLRSLGWIEDDGEELKKKKEFQKNVTDNPKRGRPPGK